MKKKMNGLITIDIIHISSVENILGHKEKYIPGVTHIDGTKVKLLQKISILIFIF